MMILLTKEEFDDYVLKREYDKLLANLQLAERTVAQLTKERDLLRKACAEAPFKSLCYVDPVDPPGQNPAPVKP